MADVRVKIGSATRYAASGVSYLPMDLAMTSWTSANGLANNITYDADLRPTSISVPNVASLAFAYDADDRITAITHGMNNAASQALSYDADGRLTGVSSGVQTASYSYDADGNRIAQTLNGTATNFSYASASNQLTATGGGMVASYGYDANGNTVSVNGSTAYVYGPFGALTNASGAAFTISAEGERLAKSFGGMATYFAPGAGGSMLAADAAGQWHDNVWLNGRLIGVIANGAIYPVHSDQTGRPIALTNATDTSIVWQATGLPFDRQVTANTWGNFNVGFPGQYFDSEDGLYQNGARDYDASLGRFIESDPIGLAGGVNTYAYVGNNPLSFVDPLGLCDCNKLEAELAKMAKVTDKFATKTGNYSIGVGVLAGIGTGIGVATSDPVALGVAGGLGVTSGAAGDVSEGASVATGLLDTAASGGDFRYMVRPLLNSVVSRMGGMVTRILPHGTYIESLTSSELESKISSWKAMAPPCDETP